MYNNNMILKVRRTWKKSESQIGFEPTSLRDIVGCDLITEILETLVSTGQRNKLPLTEKPSYLKIFQHNLKVHLCPLLPTSENMSLIQNEAISLVAMHSKEL